MTANEWRPDDTREIAALIKDIDICMFVTRSNGSVRGPEGIMIALAEELS